MPHGRSPSPARRLALIDSGVGADLNVVTDEHTLNLGHYQVPRSPHGEPEPVLTDAHAGVDDDAVSDDRMQCT